jgi:NAD(P)-dependent dehydrogenase (short-subunit alcohol dehydrogenase family)
MGRLSGKVAIITGAAGGQGAEEARLFAKEGAKVAATDVQFELLQSVVKQINEEGGEAIAFEHNVAEKKDWEYNVQATIDRFGKVDILINNAGILGKRTPLEDDEWRKVIDINVLGNALGMNTIVPEMEKVGGGSIVNICSTAALSSASGYITYTASKGALRSLSKAAAAEFAKYRIRVNAIFPGYTVTPMLQAANTLDNKEVIDKILEKIPLGRMGTPTDIAYAALFLASDESSYMTGSELLIDGGQLTRS